MSDEHPAACTSRAALTAELLTGAERSFLAGNLVMAGWLCEEIRRVEPDNPGALHLLGLIAERERRLTDASMLWRQALASHPHYTPAWLSLATLHRSTGNRHAAILCYRCLLAVDPADRDGWYNLGNVLFGGGLAEAAAEAYRRALLLDPHHDASWHNLGVARHALGQCEGALDALRRAVAYRPDNQASYHHIALIQFRAGDLDGSLTVLGRQARLAPSALDSSLMRLLAIALRDAGRTGEAIPLTTLAVTHRPENVDLRHCLGMLHSALQDITAAEAIFRTALQYGPADPFALNSYGVLLNGIGEPLAGAKLLGRSLLLQPGNAEIHSNLLLTRQYDLARSAADLKHGHLRWYRRHGASNAALSPKRRTTPIRSGGCESAMSPPISASIRSVSS